MEGGDSEGSEHRNNESGQNQIWIGRDKSARVSDAGQKEHENGWGGQQLQELRQTWEEDG